jgi:hypothetical protein
VALGRRGTQRCRCRCKVRAQGQPIPCGMRDVRQVPSPAAVAPSGVPLRGRQLPAGRGGEGAAAAHPNSMSKRSRSQSSDLMVTVSSAMSSTWVCSRLLFHSSMGESEVAGASGACRRARCWIAVDFAVGLTLRGRPAGGTPERAIAGNQPQASARRCSAAQPAAGPQRPGGAHRDARGPGPGRAPPLHALNAKAGARRERLPRLGRVGRQAEHGRATSCVGCCCRALPAVQSKVACSAEVQRAPCAPATCEINLWRARAAAAAAAAGPDLMLCECCTWACKRWESHLMGRVERSDPQAGRNGSSGERYTIALDACWAA